MTNGARSCESEIAVYLGLGSNLGDREANLREAVSRIKNLGLAVHRTSSIYETEPVGLTNQQWFLNQVVETTIPGGAYSRPAFGDPETIAGDQAEGLLSALLEIEREMGRERTIANGPRIIDIDLLLFDDLIIARGEQDREKPAMAKTDIVVPHPRLHLRRFVLEPLCEIAPELIHPVLKKTCREMLASLDDDSMVRLFRGAS